MSEPVAVLLPTRRPHLAPRFMESLRASTPEATVYACTDWPVVADDWRAAGADVVITELDASTVYQKLNRLYPLIGKQEWVFGASDDLVFHPGWFEAALKVAKETGASVIGTNDLGNPQVTAGLTATHCLIRRTYIDTIGITKDVPHGGFVTEDYVHGWVDNEIAELAQVRGVWAMALDSHVEHMHPLWGKAPSDDVYAGNFRSYERDATTFGRRMRGK